MWKQKNQMGFKICENKKFKWVLKFVKQTDTSCLLLRLDCLQRPSVPCIIVSSYPWESFLSLQLQNTFGSKVQVTKTFFPFCFGFNKFPPQGTDRNGESCSGKCQMESSRFTIYCLLSSPPLIRPNPLKPEMDTSCI